MKLKKNQVVSNKAAKVGKEKLHKANDDDGDAESDTQEYLKVSASPNKKPKIPAPEADSEEDDLDVDDEELDDEDEDFGEEGSLDDEELDDEESDGLSGDDDAEVPQLVAAGKPKAKQKVGGKEAAVEGSEDEDDEDGDEEDDDDSNLEDEEEEEDDDDDDEEDEEEEVAATKAKKPSKDIGNKTQQTKRKADDGPIEQTSKKSKQGDGIPRSIFMDIDEYDKLFLYVGNLPEGCTVEEVKALSPDIIGVRTNVKCEKLSFVFVEFKSEKMAEHNLKLLQSAKLRGRPLKVGYRGAKRADCPMTWREVQNELCVYGLPEGVPQHRVARLFPTATQVTTMAFYTLVTFESKEALLDALKNKACHSIDGCPLKFCYRLKPAGKGKKRKSRKKRDRGKSLDSNPPMSSKEAPGKKHVQKEGNKKRPGSKLFQKKAGGAADARTSKAKFDAKHKEVKKLAAAARQRKV